MGTVSTTHTDCEEISYTLRPASYCVNFVAFLQFSHLNASKFGNFPNSQVTIHEFCFVSPKCVYTKCFRDLYYRDPGAYGSQEFLDAVIEDVAALVDVPRWNLHLVRT